MKPTTLLCALGLAAGVAGCDFGYAYQGKVEQSLETLRHAELLSGHLQATPWSQNQLGLSLRVPQGMRRLPEPVVDASGNATYAEPDVEPPAALPLPNRIATFRSHVEVGVSGNRRRLPVYLYVAAADPTAGEAESATVPAGAFAEQVVAAFRQAIPPKQGQDTEALKPKVKTFPSSPVRGVDQRTFLVLEGKTTGEFVAIRGQRQVPEPAEAAVELYLYEDPNRNRAALVFYWPEGTVQAENPSVVNQLRPQIDLCVETVEFAPR
jgi:hypothetical protein